MLGSDLEAYRIGSAICGGPGTANLNACAEGNPMEHTLPAPGAGHRRVRRARS
jgi:hypothetical protein